ncbi:MAG: transporter substrate-binding domain-containing protein [Deltaproteobacteria bacterium]|nr:transporter substrate-binding domain-containing protein [Deltaproteobacteria bacterium]
MMCKCHGIKLKALDFIKAGFFLVFFVLYSFSAIFAEEMSFEKAGVILSAAEIDYPPFSIVDHQGEAGGFSIELMRAAMDAMGRDVTFRTGTWAEVRGLLEKGEVQALPIVGRTPEREQIFDFTIPYMTLHGAIVIRNKETGISDIADLTGRKVLVMKGDNAEEFLLRQDRGIDIHTVPSFEIALKELTQGNCDAVVMQRLVAIRLIEKTGFTDLHVSDKPIEGFRQDFCFAVHEGDRETLALLNEGLAIVMANGVYRHLHSKWFASMQLPSDRPIIVGGDLNYPPYEYLDETGNPVGYNVDITRAIAREMGLNVEIRLGRWSEQVQALENGKIDILQGMFYSPARDLKYDFTQPHTVSNYVSVVRKGEEPAPESISALRGKSIIVEKGDILHDFAVENGLEEQLVVVDDQEEALREMSEGKYDCALVSLVSAHYLIDKNKWSNLVTGKKAILIADYCFAAANGQKALLARFSEGLKSLEGSGEYRKIYDKWLGVYREEPASFISIIRNGSIVIIPLLGIVLIAFMWTWTLRRQVAHKTMALQESMERFRYIFEASNVGKSITLPDGRLNTNRAFADFLGYTTEELNEIKWQDVTPPEDIEAIEKIIDPLLAGDKDSAHYEKRYLHKTGKILWADVSVAIRRDAKGNPLYFMTTIVDISDRKLAEEALRNSEEYQRAMISCSPVALYSTDTGGIVMSWNISAQKIFGWSAEEVIGKPLPIIPEDRINEYHRLRRIVLEKGPFTGQELLHIKKDGALFTVSLSVAPIRNDRGEIIGIFAAAEDISEKKKNEVEQDKLRSQLLQAQKMESVGRLAGGVAHDYNNMLGVIIGYTELLIDTIDHDDLLQEYLREIMKAAMRSADITKQLLAFARKQTIEPKILDLNETLEGMLKMLRRLIGEDIDLLWKPCSGIWPVKMDQSQLDQILANLCVNSRDAISDVGKITIETDKVSIDDDYCEGHPGFFPGEYVMLVVSDNGCGMSRDVLDKLFEPFFTTKEVGKGTGLGLAMIYGIVKQNNGFINVYSEPGKGTTFRIYLPRHDEAVAPVEKSDNKEIPLANGETVIVVEDEPSILLLAKSMLERLGYNVLAAVNPDMAVTMAKEHPGVIDLLITDVVMPGMNGRDLAGIMQKEYLELKVLFMSGYTANVIAHHGVLDKGIQFIQKPFSQRELAVKVRDALKR